jgi:hypothetical protein
MYLLNTIQILVQSLVIVALEISVYVKMPKNNQLLLSTMGFRVINLSQKINQT